MKRRIFNVLAAVSLVLCTAMLLAWSLSYQRMDVFGSYPDHSLIVGQARGSILVGCGSLLDGPRRHHAVLHFQSDAPNDISAVEWVYIYGDILEAQQAWWVFGVAWSSPMNDDMRNWCVTLPHWAIVFTTLILPLGKLFEWSRARARLLAGHCPRCGYDLRATPERCPECGTAVKAAG